VPFNARKRRTTLKGQIRNVSTLEKSSNLDGFDISRDRESAPMPEILVNQSAFEIHKEPLINPEVAIAIRD
jgi:hypothetical protein